MEGWGQAMCHLQVPVMEEILGRLPKCGHMQRLPGFLQVLMDKGPDCHRRVELTDIKGSVTF